MTAPHDQDARVNATSVPLDIEDDFFLVERLAIPAQCNLVPPHAFTVSLTVGRSSLGATIAHVSNVQYVRWLDHIAELHGAHHGSSRAQLLAQQQMWFVSRHEVDYLAETFAQDRLGCATWISRTGRTTIDRQTIVWHRNTMTLACRAMSRWVFMDLTTRRPIRFPSSQVSVMQ